MTTTRRRLHESYDQLADDALVNLHDVGAVAGVQRATAYRWTKRYNFPEPTDRGLWRYGEVRDWLCSTGRLANCPGDVMFRDAVLAATGLAAQTLKVYVWDGRFPRPVGYRGQHPVWDSAEVRRWCDTRVDRRTRAGRLASQRQKATA